MRGLRNIIFTILEIIIVVLLAIFAVENIRSEQYHFIGNTISGNVWWTVAGSALLGFILAVLMLGPGRIAAGWRSRRLGRQGAQSGQELAALREEHVRLQAEHAQAVDERDRYRAALGSSIAASEAPAAPAAPVTAPTSTTPAVAATPTTATAPATSAPPPAPVVNRSAAPMDDYVVSNRSVQAPANTAPVTDQTTNVQPGQQVQQDGGGHGILRRLHIGGDGTQQDTPQEAPQDETHTPNTPATPLV